MDEPERNLGWCSAFETSRGDGVPAERFLRVKVPQSERGRHFVVFADSVSESQRSLRRYVLVTKTGNFSSLAAKDFNWVATFPPDKDRSTAVVATLESGSWDFVSPEACLTYGLLPDGAPEPRLPPEVGEFGCITFQLQDWAAAAAQTDATDGAASVTFVPERLGLPPSAQEAYRRYYAAYADINGHEISWQDMQDMAQPSTALTYGEVHFLPTLRLLQLLKVGRGDVLVDLGSGTGRLVLAAALGIPEIAHCWGIELLPRLHAAALRARALAPGGAPVEFSEGDFLDQDWSEATLVFAMTLCFPHDLLAKLEQQALALRAGARIVAMHCCFGEFLPPEEQARAFRPVAMRAEHPQHVIEMEMSFGETPLYVFERMGGNGTAELEGEHAADRTELEDRGCDTTAAAAAKNSALDALD